LRYVVQSACVGFWNRSRSSGQGKGATTAGGCGYGGVAAAAPKNQTSIAANAAAPIAHSARAAYAASSNAFISKSPNFITVSPCWLKFAGLQLRPPSPASAAPAHSCKCAGQQDGLFIPAPPADCIHGHVCRSAGGFASPRRLAPRGNHDGKGHGEGWFMPVWIVLYLYV
jgi:hypothetical protein